MPHVPHSFMLSVRRMHMVVRHSAARSDAGLGLVLH